MAFRFLRACLKIPRGAVFVQKVGWRGATKENTPCGSSTEEQRSQATFCAKTLWAAALLSFASVSSVGTARYWDAPPSPLWPKRRGRCIPIAGCADRANAGERQKSRRPEGFRAEGRLASLLLSRRPTRGILLRRASPANLLHENSTPWNFKTGSETWLWLQALNLLLSSLAGLRNTIFLPRLAA